MRMIIQVRIPNKEFNAFVRDGSADERMKRILEAVRPEAAYFTEYQGRRGAILIADVAGPSDVPRLAEPWFLGFNAEVEFHVAMTPDDLAKADLGKLGKQWV